MIDHCPYAEDETHNCVRDNCPPRTPLRHVTKDQLVALEGLLRRGDEYRSLMARAPHDGRPAMAGVGRGVAVNGAEVRGSDRWRNSRVARDEGRRIVGLPLWLTSALDTDTIEAHWPLHVETLSVATERAPNDRRAAKDVAASAAREDAARERGARLRGKGGRRRASAL